MRFSIWKSYAFFWVTLALFFGSLIGHWIFGWYAFVEEQTVHGQAVQLSDFWVEIIRDTLENWQSEFLQLVWQVAGLAYLWYLGSPQSKEGDDRKEEKLDFILKKIAPQEAEEYLRKVESKYPKK
jgi:hypothetical protein